MGTERRNKPKAVYEPGELDKTRKNIGKIDPDEATKLTKLLGGEIGVEKSTNYETKNLKQTRTYAHKRDKIVNTVPNYTQDEASDSQKITAELHALKTQQLFKLPSISSKEKSLMDKLMMSEEYQIKTNYGFFTFLFMLARGNAEKVSDDFIRTTLNTDLIHLQKFIASVKKFVAESNESFIYRVDNSKETSYRILKYIVNWNLNPLFELYKQLEKNSSNVTVSTLIPFIKTIYRSLLVLYFYGEKNITDVFKNAYVETSKVSNASQEILLKHTKNAATEWLYISGQVVKGLYPLLLRMCSTECLDFNTFFTKNISKILKFLDMTKFDLFLPSKGEPKQTTTSTESKQPEEELIEEPENKQHIEKIEQPTVTQTKPDNSIIKRGLELLDKLFPQAGWLSLENHPDMYPYFQPIYNFKDGFNLVSAENPMQVTIILLRIIEDFFQGCRNIKFSIDKEPDFTLSDDNLHDIFSEWSLYREAVFDKLYSSELKDYVNHLDTQSDFYKQPYAKKKICNMLWQAKYTFLPSLSFELVFMEKPVKDTTYKPLYRRTSYLKRLFAALISRIDDYLVSPTNNPDNMPDFGATNIMEHYHFEVPNVISRRLDAMLGGKKSRHSTNLNLLKYALCILSVLDWWINDENSPAYFKSNVTPYRALEDGSPVFSVPVLDNPNELFLKTIKNPVHHQEDNKQDI